MSGSTPFWLSLHAKGDGLALVDLDTSDVLTYADLHTQVCKLALVLGRYPRSLLLLAASNDLMGVVCYLAALVAGHPVFLAPPSLLRSTDPSLIIGYRPDLILCAARAYDAELTADYLTRETLCRYELLERRTRTDEPPLHRDLALLLSTSASTGSRKAVRLSLGNVAASTAQVSHALGVTRTERYLLNLPLSYVYGLSVLHSSLHVGATAIVSAGTWADGTFHRKVAGASVTSIAGVTQSYEYMRSLNIDAGSLPALSRLTHAGGPLDSNLFWWLHEVFGRKGVGIYLMYGQTEASGRITVLQPRALPELHRSVGRPMQSGAIAIGPQEEIEYRGPGVMLGYATSREDLASGNALNGVLHTGDTGYLDEDGNLYVTGRLSRYCKVFGRRISLDDIEALFRTDGHAAAVVEEGGSIAVFIESATPVAATAVLPVARKVKLPPQSFRLRTIPALPRTERGKLAYSALTSLAKS